jgi:hypothetical protein
MKSPGISETRRCIVKLSILAQGDIIPIKGKLPLDAELVTGVFFSINTVSYQKGVVSLRFSEGSSNTALNQFVTTRHEKRKKTKYLPLREFVSETSTLQGYYRDMSTLDVAYSLLIYIEYIPRKQIKL